MRSDSVDTKLDRHMEGTRFKSYIYIYIYIGP